MGSNFDSENQFHEGKYYTQKGDTMQPRTARSCSFANEVSFLQYEIQTLQATNQELRQENALWKDQVHDVTKSDGKHLKAIADTERTLLEERNNYRQLLQTMVQTAEENAELVVEIESLRKEKDAQITRLERDIKTLEEDRDSRIMMNSLSEEKDAQIGCLEKANKTLEEELYDVKSKLNETENNFEQLQKLCNQQEASVNNAKSINEQVESKLESQKLKEELRRLNKDENFEPNSSDPSLLEMANVVEKRTDDEIDNLLATASNLLQINANELQKLDKENQFLKEKLSSQEKQCTDILIQAKARILSFYEMFKLHRTEVNSYEERILIMDRQNKEEILKMEIQLKETLKKLSILETEKARLSNDFERASHQIEVLTQRINTLQKIPSLKQESFNVVNMNEDSGVSLNQTEITPIINRFENATETMVTSEMSNSTNHFVLRPVSLTSSSTSSAQINGDAMKELPNKSDAPSSSSYDSCRPAEFGNPVDNSPKVGTIKWIIKGDSGTVDVMHNNLFTNGNSEHPVSMENRNSYRPSHRNPVSEFKCNFCSARCISKKSLKRHKERMHRHSMMHTMDGNAARRDFRRNDRRAWFSKKN